MEHKVTDGDVFCPASQGEWPIGRLIMLLGDDIKLLQFREDAVYWLV